MIDVFECSLFRWIRTWQRALSLPMLPAAVRQSIRSPIRFDSSWDLLRGYWDRFYRLIPPERIEQQKRDEIASFSFLYKIIRRSKRTIHVLLSSRSLPATCRKLKIRARNRTIFYWQLLGTVSRSVITLCILDGVLWKARVRNIGFESDFLARDPVRLEEALHNCCNLSSEATRPHGA